MAKAGSRLPVNLVFDIDHTLLSYVPLDFLQGMVLPRGRWCPVPRTTPHDVCACASLEPAEAAARMLAEGYDSVWCTTLPYEGMNATQQSHTIALRPHVVPFFRRLLVDRALDSDRVRVDVSLWTRRPKSYAEAVAAEVLQPLIMGTRSVADGGALLIAGAHGGERCSNKTEYLGGGATWEAAGRTPFDGRHSGWKKSIGAHPSPFTTLLVDDKSENFIPWECRTGRCVHVPSFRPWSPISSWGADTQPAAPDRLFFSPTEKATEDDDPFVQHCLSLGDSGNGHASVDGGDNVTLLHLVKSFVDTCHRHATVLHQLAVPTPASRAPSLCAEAATSDFLQQFNFFEQTGCYKETWERFHVQHGTSDALIPFFYC